MASDVLGNKLRQANRLAKKYLSEAKTNLGDKEPFYDALHRALHNYLKAKLNIETSEFSKVKIRETLTDRNVEQNEVEQFTDLLQNCELARFTPSTNEDMQSDYDKAVSVITSIDKQIR